MNKPDRPVFPPGVLEALKSGNKLEAIKLMHRATKGGLVNGKTMVEALRKATVTVAEARTTARPPASIRAHHSMHGQNLPRSRSGLSPGEEPRAGSQFGGVIVLLVGVVVVIWLVSSGVTYV